MIWRVRPIFWATSATLPFVALMWATICCFSLDRDVPSSTVGLGRSPSVISPFLAPPQATSMASASSRMLRGQS